MTPFSPTRMAALVAGLATCSTLWAGVPVVSPPVYIYGTGGNGDGDKVYRIQINAENKSELFATLTGGDPSTDDQSPNGIAVDKVRGLLYYSVDDDANTTTPDKLYSIPLSTTLGAAASPTLRGTLASVANGAAMYEGDYYYLENRSNVWRKAVLEEDGDLDSNSIACTTGDATGYALGDITGLQGVLYGSVRDLGAAKTPTDTEFKFISLNLKTCTLQEFNQAGLLRQMQLA